MVGPKSTSFKCLKLLRLGLIIADKEHSPTMQRHHHHGMRPQFVEKGIPPCQDLCKDKLKSFKTPPLSNFIETYWDHGLFELQLQRIEKPHLHWPCQPNHEQQRPSEGCLDASSALVARNVGQHPKVESETMWPCTKKCLTSPGDCFTSVVLPLPRKPVTTSTGKGSGAAGAKIWFLCDCGELKNRESRYPLKHLKMLTYKSLKRQHTTRTKPMQ